MNCRCSKVPLSPSQGRLSGSFSEGGSPGENPSDRGCLRMTRFLWVPRSMGEPARKRPGGLQDPPGLLKGRSKDFGRPRV